MAPVNPVLFNLTNLQAPASGVTHGLNLQNCQASAAAPLNFSTQNYQNTIGSFTPQSMAVNNSANEIGITVSETIFGWSQYIGPGQQVAFQFPAVSAAEFVFTPDAGGVITFDVQLFDFPIFSFVNQNNANAGPVTINLPADETLPVTLVPQAIILTDASVESTGASQQLVAANASRKYLMIGAPQSEPIWINFAGGTAGPSLTGCVQLSAGGIYESPDASVPSNSVTVYCATGSLIIPCIVG